MKNIFILLFVTFCSVLIFNSCKSSTESENNYKNPNDMTWTCDTVYFPNSAQTILNKFLPFNSKNIFAYGYSSDCKNIWRWDGNKWSLVDITNKVGGFDINKMIGFSQTNIWGFGQYGSSLSKIVRYDGFIWSEYLSAGTINARLITACADKSTNIYAAGDNGWILYFNGTSWFKDQIKMTVANGGFYTIRSSAILNDTTYFTAYNTDNKTKEIYYFIKGKYKNWNVVDSTVIDNPYSQYKWGVWDLYVTPDNKLMSCGYSGVWEYTSNRWEHRLDTENCAEGLFSLNSNYIISTGALNEVYFYDGSSWKKLTKFNNDTENIIYKAAWGDGKELFMMGNTTGSFPQATLIWHGK